ncbi:VOC family protein [Halorientalis regularis]|uniref:Methylmalonyl-CoA epimerase n=1 Tax=Halorientalis regularis TaxID=660518 RepID=A0A1G7QES8_9EURY|nr:VOC family protein [Halorientalis regularis]SDF96955.1 methylmalonyl-CoA epimerase [Halorientalis regularis]
MHIDHIGILVDDIESHTSLFETLGLDVSAVETVPGFGVRIAFLPVGESLLELVEPLEEGSDLTAELAETEQRALLHHVALRVDDIEAWLTDLKSLDVPLADETPRQGAGEARVVFLERRAANGIRIELVERNSEPAFL